MVWLTLMVFAVMLTLLAVSAQDEDEAETEGWYTEEQAERGEQAYDEHCASCHGANLSGGSGPALAGDRFMRSWEGETVWTFFRVTRDTMPQHAPGSLEDETYADITAYVLQENNFPSGDEELPPERERLEELVIDPALTEEEGEEEG